MSYFLIVDGGIESLWVCVYDLLGYCFGSVVVFYQIYFSVGVCVEQNLVDWWLFFVFVLWQVIVEVGIDFFVVEVIIFVMMSCSVVVFDRDGVFLCFVIIWMDVWVNREVDDVLVIGDGVFIINGGGCGFVLVEWMIFKVFWIV